MGIPMGYVYLVLPLTGILMMLYSANNIFNVIKKRKLETEEPQISIVD
jgi:TRAP-type C4-dicarboxylate transport system permease small subunit